MVGEAAFGNYKQINNVSILTIFNFGPLTQTAALCIYFLYLNERELVFFNNDWFSCVAAFYDALSFRIFP